MLSKDLSQRHLSGRPAERYLMTLGSANSRRTMASLLNHVASLAGYTGLSACPWRQMRRDHVLAIIEALRQEDKAPSTINTCLAAIKGVMAEVWNESMVDTDSYYRIKAIRSVSGSRVGKGRAIKHNEASLLLAACDKAKTPAGYRDAALLSCLLGCGLRRAEVVGLMLADIDWEEGSLLVLGKGNKERVAYLPPITKQRIEAWIDKYRGDEPGPLFWRVRAGNQLVDKGITTQAVYAILKKRCQEAGIRGVAPHDLRRTFATRLLDNGEDIITVKEAMGHASVVTTERYDKRGQEHLKQAAERLRGD